MDEDAILQAPAPPAPNAEVRPIAPWLHTLALFVLLAGAASLSRVRAQNMAVIDLSSFARYGSSILLSWMLLGAVVAGIYHRGTFFAAALRSRRSSVAHEVALGLAVYFCGLIALALVGGLLLLTPLAHKTNRDSIAAIMPHRPIELVMWFGLSASAGICEELIFRGYLLQQFTAWTQRPVLAILLSSAVFGAVHLYEGIGAILPLMALAVVYGFVVRQRQGDLRAAMIAHTLQDFLIALFFLAKP